MNPDDPWQPVDPLGEALHFLRMNGVFYCRSDFSAPWGLSLPALKDCLMFHVVTSGQCWLQTKGEAPRLLRAGDFVLVPHGGGHSLRSEPGARTTDLFHLPRELVSERFEILRVPGTGAATQLVCGAVRFDHPVARQLLALLPPLLSVESGHGEYGEWMHAILRFMATEARSLRPGGEAVITRLADILVIQAIRGWLERSPGAQAGWLGALRDKQIGRAIAQMHRDPAQPWKLEDLAGTAAMSRSAFCARFLELVGMPPMQYLLNWRMQLAHSWLQEYEIGLAELAPRLGYQSEAAFCRAFKRWAGVAPGAVRRRLKPADTRASAAARGADGS